MTNLAAWLAFCALACFFFRGRLYIPVTLAILTFVFVPGQADGVIMPQLHPGAWFLLVILITFLLANWGNYAPMLRRTTPVAVALVVLMLNSSLDLINPSGGSSLRQWIGFVLRQMVFPYLIYSMVRTELARTPLARRFLLGGLLSMGVLQAYLSFLQVSTHGKSGYIWKSYYARSWWWSENWHIGMGTTAHPLQMGIFLVALIPLLVYVRWHLIRWALILAFLYGIASATARTASVLAVLAVGFVLAYGYQMVVRTGFILLLSTPLALALTNSKVFAALIEKFQSDNGSTQLRGDALRWALAHRNEFYVFGYPGSRDLRTEGVISSSLENAYLMAGLSFGLLFALLLVVVHLGMIVVPLRHFRLALIAPLLPCVFTMIAFNGSSSFMAGGLEGTTFWVFLAIYHAAAYDPQETDWGASEAETVPQPAALDQVRVPAMTGAGHSSPASAIGPG